MARIVFDPTEAESLRQSARSELPGNPTLARVLNQLADEGIDLEKCVPYEQIRAPWLPPIEEVEAQLIAEGILEEDPR